MPKVDRKDTFDTKRTKRAILFWSFTTFWLLEATVAGQLPYFVTSLATTVPLKTWKLLLAKGLKEQFTSVWT